jgi:dienelactone hydrolase
MRSGAWTILVGVVGLSACGGGDPVSMPTAPSTPANSSAPLTIQGDPESASGATWTYRGTLDGVAIDLQGILFKPPGAGPLPAVVISHGAGGTANGYSRGIALEMVRWGLVCIATNYTHSGAVAIGTPGTANEPGASTANVLRAHVAREILKSIGYVDMTRVAAHGHSMGAFVTTALVAAYPSDFRVASHTAGGVRTGGFDGAAPTEAQARAIRTPYQLHHGDADIVVSLASDQRLAAILGEGSVAVELHVYAGATHEAVARDDVVLGRVRSWYAANGLF